MANDVFANGREIACKAGAGKTICAFPDVCFTPPENPATPPGIPVPYPNTGFASDTTKGSKTVKITKKEIMLKNKSYFKTSVGDEAGCAAKKGVITSKNKGKVYFQAWSMDVKVEGKNVDRHLDLTTNNHASQPGDTPPWPFTDSMALAKESINKKDEKWGHKRGKRRHDCKGKHTWKCDKAECPDCWQPPCVPNAVKTQKEYKESQSGTGKEKKDKFKESNKGKVDAGDIGAKNENLLADATADDDFISGSYKAHCTKCHTIAELDVVTSDSVIEVKSSAGGVKIKQMRDLIVPVAEKCFPGKKVKVAVPKDELDILKKKLGEKEWKKLSIEAIGF